MNVKEAALTKKFCLAIVIASVLAACVPGHTSRYCNRAEPDEKDPSRPAQDCKSEIWKGDRPDAIPASVAPRTP
jgi:hypothetical protein